MNARVPAWGPRARKEPQRNLSAERLREPAGLVLFAVLPPAFSPTACGGAPSRGNVVNLNEAKRERQENGLPQPLTGLRNDKLVCSSVLKIRISVTITVIARSRLRRRGNPQLPSFPELMTLPPRGSQPLRRGRKVSFIVVCLHMTIAKPRKGLWQSVIPRPSQPGKPKEPPWYITCIS